MPKSKWGPMPPDIFMWFPTRTLGYMVVDPTWRPQVLTLTGDSRLRFIGAQPHTAYATVFKTRDSAKRAIKRAGQGPLAILRLVPPPPLRGLRRVKEEHAPA